MSKPRYYVEDDRYTDYVVMDSDTDTVICTCYTQKDAELITQALNAFPNP